MSPRTTLVVALGACAVLVASTLRLLRAGFVGISNDDAARTLIATDFARHPTLDPTRSSWLPVPTYILGSVLRTTPRILDAARGSSLLAGCSACMLAALLCRVAGARTGGTVFAVVAAATWRWSVLCAIAPGVPEMVGVAFLLAGALALTVDARWASVSGGVALGLACGCRYEAWFAALALLVAVARTRDRRGQVVLAACIAGVVPVVWLCLNAARTGDALDFVHRVERFRRGEGLPPWPIRLGLYPWLVLRELGPSTLLAAVGAHSARALDRRVFALPAAVVALCLVMSEVRGGGATHHPARALLPFAWLLVPLVARGMDVLWHRGGWRRTLAICVCGSQCVLWRAGHPEEQSSVAPATVATGHDVAVATGHDRRWLLELDRQDFLWVEVVSEAPDRCLPDRRYSGPPPTADELTTRSTGVDVAAVSSDGAAAVLKSAGFQLRTRHGAWRMMVR